jgi:sortase family protein
MPRSTIGRAALVAAAAAMLALGVVSGLLAARPPAPPVAQGQPAGAGTAAPAAAPTNDPWWVPLPPARAPFVPVQLVIAKLRLRAPVEAKGIDARNVMEAPDRLEDVAWYRFTARPGAGSNAVFAGRRESGQTGSSAVFRQLDQIEGGDLVDVVSAQRTEIRYRVTGTRDYPVRGMPMQEVLAAGPTEEITLITTAGTFTAGAGYDRRLVIRAVPLTSHN